MYRTKELYELLFQGIPNSLRNELWLMFSGAGYEVRFPSRLFLATFNGLPFFFSSFA